MIEDKKEKLKRQKDIGQFFTPQEVVGFVYDMLKVQLDKEERWRVYVGKKRKKLKKPSIIDPACGEGIFLKISLEKEITYPSHIFGVDIDDKMKEEWKRINLLTKFGSEARLESKFFHQNGLLPIKCDSKYKYRGVKKNALKEFDLVVGNPPYGGVGLKEITPELEKALLRFDVWRNDKDQPELFDKSQIEILGLGDKRKERLEKFPIEILFIDRFIQLTKPGGHIAIIIPDGILSNANLHYVREFIADNVKVDAIVSLPRDTFKNVGTSAKTSILFMTKPLDGKIESLDYPVFLATVQNLEGLTKVYELYSKYQKEGNLMNPIPEKVLVVKDSDGNEAVTIRVDVTPRKMFEQKPMTRWDPLYWDPKYDALMPLLNKWNAKTLEEIEGEGCIISGDHVRPSRGESKGYNLNTGIEYYETKNFLVTGYDYSKIKECSKNAYDRLKYTAVSQHDILISCAGVGGVGKARSCLITHRPKMKSCTGDVFIIRLKKLSPFFVYVLLNSKVCKDQIMRNRSGVGTENINTDQALSLRILIMPKHILAHIEKNYNSLLGYHDKAMKAKAKGDEASYKKNIATAEKMLKDLIARTEAIIRGEREDIL